MDSNSQYPYEDNPEGRRPVPAHEALEATRRRVLKQAGMTDEEIDRVLQGSGVDAAARRAIIAANERSALGTTRAEPDMVEWADRFIEALNADAIHPIDF